MRRVFTAFGAASALMTSLLAIVLLAAPAHAEINRCGDSYTTKSASHRMDGDSNTPAIQPYRVRWDPGTYRVCEEFLSKNSSFSVRDYHITLSDTASSPAGMICAALSCKWAANDDPGVFVEVSYYAAPDWIPWAWTKYSDSYLFMQFE